MSTLGKPCARNVSPMPASGASRFFSDVVRQRLERRHVDDLSLVRELARQSLPHQTIDRREKSGQRLAGSGGSGDQDVLAGVDRRPRRRLRRGGRFEAMIEPGGDRRMKQRGWVHGKRPMYRVTSSDPAQRNKGIIRQESTLLQKSGFDRSVNVRFHYSFNGGHYRRGGLDVVKDATGRAEERPSQATGYGTGFAGASAARVLDNIDPLAKLAAMR